MQYKTELYFQNEVEAADGGGSGAAGGGRKLRRRPANVAVQPILVHIPSSGRGHHLQPGRSVHEVCFVLLCKWVQFTFFLRIIIKRTYICLFAKIYRRIDKTSLDTA